jgi:hypothetical protein
MQGSGAAVPATVANNVRSAVARMAGTESRAQLAIPGILRTFGVCFLFLSEVIASHFHDKSAKSACQG